MSGAGARWVVCAFAATACRPTSDTSAAPMSAIVDSPAVIQLVRIGERFSPQSGAAALRAFIPEVAPVETGGECRLTRTRPGGATTVSAYFPSFDSARAVITLMFDTAGNLVRFSDRRGLVRFPGGRGRTMQELDSIRRASEARIRSTSINFDYPVDQAIATNSGGGKPTEAIIAPVPEMQHLEKLGPPVERIRLARRLCSV